MVSIAFREMFADSSYNIVLCSFPDHFSRKVNSFNYAMNKNSLRIYIVHNVYPQMTYI